MPASLINDDQFENQQVLGGKPQRIPKPPKPNPAAQSLNRFGGMINENIVQPVKNVLGYPGQVIAGTINQAASGLESLGNTVKENYNKDRDYSQLAKSSLDPTNPYGNNYSPEAKPVAGLGNFGTPSAEQISQSLGKLTPEQEQQSKIEREQQAETQYKNNVSNIDPGHITDVGALEGMNATPEQQYDNNAEKQLPGSEFLPEKNKLTAQPGIGDGGIPEFDGKYVGSNYADSSNKTKNEERFNRNRADALKQDQASSEMVNRINLGTNAMAEVRDLRAGGTGRLDNPLSTGEASLTPEQQTSRDRLGFDQKKYIQERMDKNNKRTGKPQDAISSDLWNQIHSTKIDENTRSFLTNQLQKETGYTYAELKDYIKRTTQPRSNDDPFAGLDKNL